jgi:glyoxylase-like metal-dependent hydrolase (beta-lactamase superfamily II)
MRSVQRAVGGVCRLHPADRPLLEALAQQGALFGLPHAEPPDSVVDLTAGETIAVGRGELRVLFTPGHSPGHVSFHAAGDLWSGDVLFAGSIGRTDLPGGSFETLERSIVETLFPLGDGVIVHTGHGEETTLGEERLHNPFVGAGARAR